jgi:cold-inducible RNA-binding protein
MATNLFVAGLSYDMAENELRDLFADYGTVVSAKIVTDRETNRSKGFGFVEMSTEEESKNAIQGLNGKDMNGRSLTVNEARPRENRPARPFGGNRSDHTDHRGSLGNNFRRSHQ